MDRTKYTKRSYPFAGILPDDNGRLDFTLISDVPTNIAHTNFLLKLAADNCDSDNPFQDLGIDERIIFDIQDGKGTAIKDVIEEVVLEFQDRLDLESTSFEIREDSESGNDYVSGSIHYTPFDQDFSLSKLFPSLE